MKGIMMERVVSDDAPAGAPSESGSTAQPIPMSLSVTHIQCYERNPRQCRNPEYERIKASIRARGLDHPLVITQRPGKTDYIVCAGGNTCLQILKELHLETDDERFLLVNCLFQPWHSETDVLLGHLRENDLRGNLAFIDKARAIQALKTLVIDETNAPALSQRQLIEALRERGYHLSQGLVSQMEYAVEVLLPVMPQALQAGMGRPQIERIRALDRVVRTLWVDREMGTEPEYEETFATLCRRLDGPDWETDSLRDALEAEISVAADIDRHIVRLTFDACLAGRALPEFEDDNACTVTDAETRQAPGDVLPAGEQPPRQPSTLDEGGTEVVPNPRQADDDTHQRPASDQNVAGNGNGPDEAQNTEEIPVGHLAALRSRAWELALRIAQRNGLGEIIQPLPQTGLGFLLHDVPDPVLNAQLDDEQMAQIAMIWWHLAACSELTVAPVARVVEQIEPNSVVHRALETQDASVLFDNVWTLDPGQMGYRLWRRLDDSDWSDLIDLMETYRALHRAAAASGETLWS